MLQIAETLLVSSSIGNRPYSSERSTRKTDAMPFLKSISKAILRQARAHSNDSTVQQNNRHPTPANLEDPSRNSQVTPRLHYEEVDPNQLTPSIYTAAPAPVPTIPFNNGFLHPGSYIFTDLATTGTKGKGKTILPPPSPPRQRPDPNWPTCKSKDCPLNFAHEAGPYNFDEEVGNIGLPTPPDVILQAMLNMKLLYNVPKSAALVVGFKLVHAWPDC